MFIDDNGLNFLRWYLPRRKDLYLARTMVEEFVLLDNEEGYMPGFGTHYLPRGSPVCVIPTMDEYLEYCIARSSLLLPSQDSHQYVGLKVPVNQLRGIYPVRDKRGKDILETLDILSESLVGEGVLRALNMGLLGDK